jgi:topoisomerase-4 subunit A
MAKRKEDPKQPELPKRATEPAAPSVNGVPDKNSAANANGETHIKVEDVPAEVVHRPFVPSARELELHKRVDTNFLQYASYVIRDRAIPNIEDGLKPVQRRILWALKRMDDGRLIKVATVSGEAMKYHPHGQAAIDDALVVLANKRYLIEGQGNYGNIYTGDPAAASRYIECRLTDLARKEIFNDELTDFIPSYDGRNQEPVALPSKLPLTLMLGAEGIAVGLSCRILPHNFIELLEAQIAILKGENFRLIPDFLTGGLMDAREYNDGRGSIKVRAKIKAKDENTVVISEIPPTTTTESLIASIEAAVDKGKLKVRSINDYTAENPEIELKAPAGVTPDQLIKALYAFTDCEISIASRITVIKNNRPVEMTASEILRENTTQAVALYKRELEVKEGKLNDELHFRTLERIFIEERIYKKIEQCKTNEAVIKAVYDGFKPFEKEILRDITNEDVDRLLQVRIRRISLFDINKHREELERIKGELAETRKSLKNLTKYVIGRIQALIDTYKDQYPRLTKSSRYDEVEAKDVAFKAFKVSYDREKGYIGYKAGGEEFKMDCTRFDKLLLVFKDGHYKMVELQEKLFVGPDLVYCGLPERDRVFTCAYTNREASYLKRFTFGGMILDREYFCIQEKSRILYFEPDTPAQLYIKYRAVPHQKISQQICKPAELEVRGAKSRGNQISIKDVQSVNEKPPRNWDSEATTTELKFA